MSKIFAGVYFRKFSDFYYNSRTFKLSIFYIVCTFRWCIGLFPLTSFTLDETSTRWSFLITVRTQPPFTLSNSTKEIFSKSVKSECKQKEAETNSLLCITEKCLQGLSRKINTTLLRENNLVMRNCQLYNLSNIYQNCPAGNTQILY